MCRHDQSPAVGCQLGLHVSKSGHYDSAYAVELSRDLAETLNTQLWTLPLELKLFIQLSECVDLAETNRSVPRSPATEQHSSVLMLGVSVLR